MSDSSQRALRSTYAYGGAALATLVLLITASFWLVGRTQSSTADVLKSRERQIALSSLMLTLLNSETGQRGYLLTGAARYLEPYEVASGNVKAQTENVEFLFRDDPAARVPLAALRPLIQAKLDELAETVELKKSGKSNEALAIVESDRGKDLMDQLRSAISLESERVDRMLRASIDDQRSNALSARQVAFGAVLIILLAALGAIATIVRYTKELLVTRQELRTVNLGLEERVQERTRDLKRANDEIQRFAYIVSHDLRSPLVNVMGYTSELESSLGVLRNIENDPQLEALAGGQEAKIAISTDMPEAIGFIRRSTSKMDGLIKAILKLSREGQRVLTSEQINLDDFFSSIIANAQHRISELDGEINIVKPMPTINNDRLALEQIFVNLLDNALKYRVPGRPPKIVIRQVGRSWGSIVVEFEDNSRGIAESDSERVFDLFRRAGPQDQPGEGIGLAHVRALVRRLGGEISMTSQLGKGTTFRVTLPKKLQITAEQSSG